MAKILMIIILGGFISFGILSVSQNKIVNQGTQNASKIFSEEHARNIANSMAQMLLSEISDSASWRVNTYSETDFAGGSAVYRVIDTVLSAEDTVIKVSVTGKYFNSAVDVTVFAEKLAPGFVPPVVRGVWTANGPLNKTISDMYIDGRDHKLDGTLIPHTGVFGISTSIPWVNTENAEIGGTRDSIDYPMSFPENPNVIEENYNWGGHFPNTPDEALGLPEGTLKSIAQSGKDGSQYATKANDLEFPLSGVTYLELPEGKSDKIDMSSNGNGKGKGHKKEDDDDTGGNEISKGILVIHNENGTTEIKQTKTGNGEWFEGIIIGDYMFHFHCDVHGAIILLSPNLETSHNCNGNKDHHVWYSAQSIRNATKIVGISKYNAGNYENYGFAQHRVKVRHWLE